LKNLYQSFAGVFRILAASLRGEEHDYTTGSISKAVVLLAIPMILELSLESVFALVDMFFVGRLGPDAIATVGLTESVITLVYSLAIGLSTAATAIVARRIGEKHADAAAHAGAQSIIVAIILVAILSPIGVFMGDEVLAAMGASPAVVCEGAIFTRIMFGGSISIVLLFLINGIFRGAGNAAMAMKSLWIASGVNIILCPVFIHFFGLKGAAIATVTGRTTGVLYQCYHLFLRSKNFRFRRSHFLFDPAVVRSIVKLSWPAAFQFIIASGSWILLVRLIAETGGTAASAGTQIAFRNFVFFILPAWGLSNAVATLVGQNLGAGQLERAEKSVFMIARYNAAFMGFVMFLFLFFSVPIVRFFTDEPAVITYAARTLQIMGSGFVFYGIGMVMVQALNGSGDTRTPTLINFFCFWCFQIPLAYFLSKGLHMETTGVVIAIPVAESLIALVAWYYFRKGSWKTVSV
jgi:putative MATE family efflux protein